MKFLIDVNTPAQLGEMLKKHGHTYRHVALLKREKAQDSEILSMANENDEVILTHDLDFGQLLAISGKERPSVVIFRIHKINAQIFFNLLIENWDSIENPLMQGSVVIIETFTIRIRKLPIKK